ncbi:MAG: aminotransferase class I/II-fold pyridoxal phosphate-dependent enzyme [Candidatus Baltobacteraceae bacterium]|jgi:histidinol-phosphate aminotransferase
MRAFEPSPLPAPAIAALPLTTPFVAPEELARRAGHAELLRLGANESPFGPPPRAMEAMRAELGRTSWYGDPESMQLREALAARHACGVENITVAAGIDDLLGLSVRGFLAPGDVTVATLGSYPTYAYHVAGFGARLETVPYESDGSVALERLAERARATGARLVYLANPDNPSGSFVPRARVEALVEALPEGAALVLDEAYADFVEPGELLAATIDPRVIRLRTFSKAYGMAGARIGYCLAASAVVQVFQKIRHHYGVNRTAQIGALAALGEERFVAGAVAEIVRGREEYQALGERLGLATLPSHTNFVCFDLGSRARAEAMVEELLRRAVFVRKPGAPPLDGHIRVTVGTASERARFALAFADALEAREPA